MQPGVSHRAAAARALRMPAPPPGWAGWAALVGRLVLGAVFVAVGLLLVLGVAVRLGAVVSTVLLLLFMVGVGSAWARGLTIDCGCFGGGGPVAAGATRYGSEMLRDTALLLVAAGLALWPASRLALSAPATHAPTDAEKEGL
ncbi:MAG: hypothetical protein LH461_04110 [Spirochaetaceae bacterium]|nr:hypothetical protein [Spirochaetaceae bacterium]